MDRDVNMFDDLTISYDNLKSTFVEYYQHSITEKSSKLDEINSKFKNIREMLKDRRGQCDPKMSPSAYKRLLAMEASILFEQCNTPNCKEPLEKLEEALTLLEPVADQPEIAYIYYKIINLYAGILLKFNQIDKAQKILEQNEQLSQKITQNDVEIEVLNINDLFSKEEIDHTKKRDKELRIYFDRLVTSNLEMLANIWIYRNDHKKSAEYQHEVLLRQLESKDQSCLIWSLNTAHLAVFYIHLENFTQARYYLGSASLILNQYQKDLEKYPSEGRLARMMEFQYYYGELANDWVSYALQLFEISKVKVLAQLTTSFQDPFASKNPAKKEENAIMSRITTNSNELLKFPSINPDVVDSICVAEPIEKLDDARKLFYFTLRWLKFSQQVFTIENNATRFVENFFHLNDLYKYLALFETDLEVLYGLSKFRADTLDSLNTILSNLKLEHFIAVRVDLMHQLVEVHLELSHMNLRRLSLLQETTPNEILDKMDALKDLQTVTLRGYQAAVLGRGNGAGKEIDTEPTDSADYCNVKIKSPDGTAGAVDTRSKHSVK